MINKEKIIDLPNKIIDKDRKRRRTTHFTTNKHKKKVRQRSILKKGLKSIGKSNRKKTLILNPNRSSAKLNHKDSSFFESQRAPIRIEKIRVSSTS